MRELPILYSPDMVRAKLAGRKTQTRRLVKGGINAYPDDYTLFDIEANPTLSVMYDDESLPKVRQGIWAFFQPNGLSEDYIESVKSRYNAGDILYVKERFTQNGLGYYRYYADWDDPTKGPFIGESVPEKFRGKWKNSLFMPKEAARIWERVTNVRVERLPDITESDAIAEGIEQMFATTDWWVDYMDRHKPNKSKDPYHGMTYDPIQSYFSLWESIYGKESLDSNPWVWVYETELLSTTGKPDNL